MATVSQKELLMVNSQVCRMAYIKFLLLSAFVLKMVRKMALYPQVLHFR